jgi:hypothetical protein
MGYKFIIYWHSICLLCLLNNQKIKQPDKAKPRAIVGRKATDPKILG